MDEECIEQYIKVYKFIINEAVENVDFVEERLKELIKNEIDLSKPYSSNIEKIINLAFEDLVSLCKKGKPFERETLVSL